MPCNGCGVGFQKWIFIKISMKIALTLIMEIADFFILLMLTLYQIVWFGRDPLFIFSGMLTPLLLVFLVEQFVPFQTQILLGQS